jgi:hypothetical protein
MDNLLSLILSRLHNILETALQLPDRITRISVVYSVLNTLQKIHEKCANKGIHNNTWTTDSLSGYVGKINKSSKNRF